MDTTFQKDFLARWKKHFDGAELPIAFFYSADPDPGSVVKQPKGHRCVIADLGKVRKGKDLAFDVRSLGCGGAQRYCGFASQLRENFEYFLSYGIPGKLEGERYKKSPEIVRDMLAAGPTLKAPKPYIVFKRWDRLGREDEPDVAVFFCRPDVMAGLFTLASFDERDQGGVIAPFAAGCGGIVLFPWLEQQAARPRCVIGMFDVSARPFVEGSVLTFSVPLKKLRTMVGNMDESFLITPSWAKVRRRISHPGLPL